MAANSQTTVAKKAQVQPRATTSNSSPVPQSTATPRSGQHATPKSIPQKRSFSEHQPSLKLGSSPALTEVMAKARAALIASKSKPSESHQTKIQGSGEVVVFRTEERHAPPSDPQVVAQVAIKQREQNARAKTAQRAPPFPSVLQEPPLKQGEAPTLATQPNLIAQMLAKKRAEAEKLGLRERWKRRQEEYRISNKSPGAQLTNDLNAEVKHNGSKQEQARTVANPLPAQSTPTMPPLESSVPIVFNAQASTSTSPPDAARTVAKSVQEPGGDDDDDEGEIDAAHENDNDSLFGSSFSSPIVEFLEKATDHAGLKEARQPTRLSSSTAPGSSTTATVSQRAENTKTATPVFPDSSNKSHMQSEIPPLFSDKPPATQPQYQTPSAASKRPIQAPSQSNGTQTQLNSRQPSGSGPTPYFPRQETLPGYYRFDSSRDWPSNLGSFEPSSATPTPMSNANGQALPPASGAYGGYVMNAMPTMNPYVAVSGPLIPSGPVQTYGSTAPPMMSTGDKMQAANGGYLTAADLVAGINFKFKNATKNSFRVPKR